MWSVIVSALAARRGQAVIVLLVAALASAATAMAPWYAVSATRQVAVDTLAGAPTASALISVSMRRTGEQGGFDPSEDFRNTLHPDGFTTVVGATSPVRLGVGGASGEDEETGTVGAMLAYREDVCAHLSIRGDCPAAADEVLIPASLAEAEGIEIGDPVRILRSGQELAGAHAVGIYQVLDATEPYWGDGELIDPGADDARYAVFAPLASVVEFELVIYTYQLVVEPDLLATLSVEELEAMVAQGVAALRAKGYTVDADPLTALTERITTDRRNVVLGVGVGVAVLLLLTWFALGVVLRSTATQVRTDVGWWRLHGAPPARGWLMVLSQSAVPVIGGALLGGAAGVGIAHAVVPELDPDRLALAWRLTVALVGIVVAGALITAVVSQAGTLRTPVRDLLRRVPPRGPRWRRSLVDLTVLLLAGAAVGQALITGGDAEGVVVLAPPLAVLAIALLVAWLVPVLAAPLAARAVHAGRLGAALVAASMARRSGSHRLFALVAVAVGLVTTGFVGWDLDTRTQWQRAALEAGADRVLTVEVTDAARLLAAVRTADPSGTAAMAVLYRPGTGGGPAVLAVDSPRLGVVSGWREEFGGSPDELAARLRPPAPEPVHVPGEALLVEAAAERPDGDPTPDGDPVYLRLRLQSRQTGAEVTGVVGPLAGEPERYRAALPGCAPDGCRLVGVELLGRRLPDGGHAPPASGVQVEVLGLFMPDGTPVGSEVFADPSRWRPPVSARELGPLISAVAREAEGREAEGRGGEAGAEQAGISLTIPEPDRLLDPVHQAFVVDAPVPLPVVTVGWSPPLTAEARFAPLTGSAVPVEVVGKASLLPASPGSTVLVDLEYAQRLAPIPAAGSMAQVWLTEGAPDSIVDSLREAGVTPVREESLSAAAARLRSEGSAVSVRFQAAVALVGLLLAAGALLAVAGHERAGRAAELVALRQQGLGAGVVRAVGYGGPAAVAITATLVGLAAGMVGAVLGRLLHPGFIDGWDLLAPPGYHPLPVTAAAGLSTLLFGSAVLVAAAGLIRGTRTGSTRTRGRSG